MSTALEQVARGRVLHRRPHNHRLAVSRPVSVLPLLETPRTNAKSVQLLRRNHLQDQENSPEPPAAAEPEERDR
jgi:hypothetical protein